MAHPVRLLLAAAAVAALCAAGTAGCAPPGSEQIVPHPAHTATSRPANVLDEADRLAAAGAHSAARARAAATRPVAARPVKKRRARVAIRTTAPIPHRPAAGTVTRRPTATPGGYTIRRYMVAYGSQPAIDRCNVVLWADQWLAAHNWCGYQWWAWLKTGTVIEIPSGPARGTYRVIGHQRLNRQSGALPPRPSDLVLQTCVGRQTDLTLARRLP